MSRTQPRVDPHSDDKENPTANPPRLFLPYVHDRSEKLQTVCREIGGNAKKSSNKGGRDYNKYNRHPYITHTCILASHNSLVPFMELL